MSSSHNVFSRLSSQWTDTDKIAIETSAGTQYCYGDILRITARLANALKASGVKPGSRVAVQAEKSPEALLLYLACLRMGAAYLPLNTAYTETELDYFLSDAEPSVFVCSPGHEDRGRAICERNRVSQCLSLGTENDGTLIDLAASQTDVCDDVASADGDLAAILYTSGTTGRSKGAMLTHGNLTSNALALNKTWRITSADVLLHALPIFHAHGLFVATNTILMANASMLLLPRFDLDGVFRMLLRSTVMMGVPTFYVRLLGDPRLSAEAVSHMRLFISGSAPLLPGTYFGFLERTGHAILERYGMTETGMNTSNPFEGDRVPGAVGLPLPGVEVRITHTESGERLGPDEIGMIEVRGPNVFKGYWRMPEKTQSEFRSDGFFITGDLGKIDQRGYVHIVGRGKDLIISGGFNVYPKEVESEINTLPGVVESAVIGVPHPDFGEGVMAVVVLEKDSELQENDIIEPLKKRLANYKLPKRVFFSGGLPRNAMGKVQKNLIRDAYGDLFRGAS